MTITGVNGAMTTACIKWTQQCPFLITVQPLPAAPSADTRSRDFVCSISMMMMMMMVMMMMMMMMILYNSDKLRDNYYNYYYVV